jgi:hypothetical protein
MNARRNPGASATASASSYTNTNTSSRPFAFDLSSAMAVKPWERIESFLPAGALRFDLKEKHNIDCDHGHASDGCHVFQGRPLLSLVSTALEQQLLEGLDFLHSHHYIYATRSQSLSEDFTIARVYLIPQDLPNAGHFFRQRPTNIVARAKFYLQIILSHVVRDVMAWCGRESKPSVHLPPLLLEDENVGIFISTMSQSLKYQPLLFRYSPWEICMVQWPLQTPQPNFSRL